MSDIPRNLIIGLFEWDGSIEPTIILGTSREKVERAAVEALMYTDGTSPTPRLPFGDDDGWLDDNPYPDLDDAAAVSAWLEALADDDELRSSTEFNIWEDYTIA